MTLIDFFEDEIRYFLEEAPRFADRHREQAKALRLEDVRERDPYVERLIEAFAFLTGSIRRRLDNEFGELAQELLSVVWPHYLYPLPASVILHAALKGGATSLATEIAPGALIESGFVSSGLPCRFSLRSRLLVRPVKVTEAALVSRPDGRTALRLRLSSSNPEIPWDKTGKEPLRLYLHGDPGFALTLYYMLLTDVTGVAVRHADAKETELPPSVITQPVTGPGEDLPLLPYPDLSFPGFRLLEEYFFFPEKFRFLDLDVLRGIDGTKGGDVLIDLLLTGHTEWRVQPKAGNFLPHCAPAVNLFERPGEPVRVDDSRREYRVMADLGSGGHYVPHHVLRVEGMRFESGQRVTYEPFFSYRHEDGQAYPGYYHLRRRHGVDGAPNLLLSLSRPPGTGAEVLSLDLMCGNDKTVRELRLGDVRHPLEGIPDTVGMENITVPCLAAWPRLDGRELWPLVNCLALNYMSLDTKDRLRNMLLLYDRKRTRANRQRIEGVESVEARAVEKMMRGFPVRGVAMDVALDEEKFTNRGDLLVFASVFSRVMAMFVAINSFCHLRVTERDSGVVHQWPLAGEQALI
jgi:type VI secretion system protein ImpG